MMLATSVVYIMAVLSWYCCIILPHRTTLDMRFPPPLLLCSMSLPLKLPGTVPVCQRPPRQTSLVGLIPRGLDTVALLGSCCPSDEELSLATYNIVNVCE